MLRRRIESLDAADVPYRVEHVDYRARHVAAAASARCRGGSGRTVAMGQAWQLYILSSNPGRLPVE